jgi:hypothetical protein
LLEQHVEADGHEQDGQATPGGELPDLPLVVRPEDPVIRQDKEQQQDQGNFRRQRQIPG